MMRKYTYRCSLLQMAITSWVFSGLVQGTNSDKKAILFQTNCHQYQEVRSTDAQSATLTVKNTPHQCHWKMRQLKHLRRDAVVYDTKNIPCEGGPLDFQINPNNQRVVKDFCNQSICLVYVRRGVGCDFAELQHTVPRIYNNCREFEWHHKPTPLYIRATNAGMNFSFSYTLFNCTDDVKGSQQGQRAQASIKATTTTTTTTTDTPTTTTTNAATIATTEESNLNMTQQRSTKHMNTTMSPPDEVSTTDSSTASLITGNTTEADTTSTPGVVVMVITEEATTEAQNTPNSTKDMTGSEMPYNTTHRDKRENDTEPTPTEETSVYTTEAATPTSITRETKEGRDVIGASAIKESALSPEAWRIVLPIVLITMVVIILSIAYFLYRRKKDRGKRKPGKDEHVYTVAL